MRSITSRRAAVLSVLAAAGGTAFMAPGAAAATPATAAPVVDREPDCPGGTPYEVTTRGGKTLTVCIRPMTLDPNRP